MKKILLIVGVAGIVVCVLSLLCAQIFLHMRNGTYDASANVYTLFRQMREICLLIGGIFGVIGAVSLIARAIL